MAVWKHRPSARLQADADQLIQKGDIKGAVLIWQHLAERHPNNPQALEILGTLRGMIGAYEPAVRALRKALDLDPKAAGASYNLGLALLRLGRFDEARAALRRAIEIAPGMANAHGELGRAYQDAGDLEAAVPCYREAARLDPGGMWLSDMVACQRNICSWDGLEESERLLLSRLEQSGQPINPLIALYLTDDPRFQKANAAAYFASVLAPTVHGEPPAGPGRERPRSADGGRLRIGYLSADFHDHATAHLIAELIELHDRSRFEVVGYSYGPNDKGSMRARLEKGFDSFVECAGRSSAEIAGQIGRQGIQVLIDLKGYTRHTRIDVLAYRPAPVQIHYLGFPGTLMCPWVDYLVVDPTIVPAEAEEDYGEALCVLPHTYQVNDRQRTAGGLPPVTRANQGLPEEGFVFCAFHASIKLSPEIFGRWLDILARVPGSVLWLLIRNDAAIANLKAYAERHGIAAERIVAAPRVPLNEHLARLALADLLLDAFPYGAHTTGSEALWMGVPVVTRTGRSFASRVAASLLTAHGLDDLITSTWDEYRDLAVRIATTPGLAGELKARVLANRDTHPLFDSTRFCRNFEAALEEMWERHCRGEAPSRLAIADAA